MKYIKSKGGYFYKAYKNEKKKRVSKEEFMKHKKPAKKKRLKKSIRKYKMKGGLLKYTTDETVLTITNLEAFLEKCSLNEYTKELQKHITMSNKTYIMEVNEELLEEFGMVKHYHRKRFMRHLELLKEDVNLETFLEECSLNEYIEELQKHITMSNKTYIMEVNEELLEEFGMVKHFHRKRFMRHLELLKEDVRPNNAATAPASAAKASTSAANTRLTSAERNAQIIQYMQENEIEFSSDKDLDELYGECD